MYVYACTYRLPQIVCILGRGRIGRRAIVLHSSTKKPWPEHDFEEITPWLCFMEAIPWFQDVCYHFRNAKRLVTYVEQRGESAANTSGLGVLAQGMIAGDNASCSRNVKHPSAVCSILYKVAHRCE